MAELRMTPALLHLLLALGDGPRHGYALLKDLEGREVAALGPSSLYYSLSRLEEAGLIVEADPSGRGDGEPHEEQRRYFQLTEAGRERLREEARVLDEILERARAQGLA